MQQSIELARGVIAADSVLTIHLIRRRAGPNCSSCAGQASQHTSNRQSFPPPPP
jgi:hypothetical protein